MSLNPGLPLLGKKILWLGTSIPAQYGMNSYPALFGQYHQCTVDNQSVASSHLFWNSTSDKLSLTASKSELESKYPGSGNQSWESKVKGKNADWYFIDHGYNDRNLTNGHMGSINDATDRGTFYGAFNFLIKAIYTDNPDAKIALIIPPNNVRWATQWAQQKTLLTDMKDGILQIGLRYGAPVCNLQPVMQYNDYTYGADGAPKRTHDGTHPTQITSNEIGVYIYNWAKGLS